MLNIVKTQFLRINVQSLTGQRRKQNCCNCSFYGVFHVCSAVGAFMPKRPIMSDHTPVLSLSEAIKAKATSHLCQFSCTSIKMDMNSKAKSKVHMPWNRHQQCIKNSYKKMKNYFSFFFFVLNALVTLTLFAAWASV